MTGFGARSRKSLEVARETFGLLASSRIDSAVIGSVAVAVHNYLRATRDLDLGVCVLAFDDLRRIADRLRASGHEVEVSEPAPDDPLGGVVTVSGPDFDPVQIVNLRSPGGRRPRLAQEAIASAEKEEELGLPVVDLPHLVALKLVAGSRKDELDIIELLRANPGQIESVVAVAGRYRLKKQLDRVVSAS